MALAQFTERLKTFRPAATVFEAEIARVKSTFANPLLLEGGSGALGRGGKSTEVMATKRAAHAHIIEKERQKKASGRGGRCRGSEGGGAEVGAVRVGMHRSKSTGQRRQGFSLLVVDPCLGWLARVYMALQMRLEADEQVAASRRSRGGEEDERDEGDEEEDDDEDGYGGSGEDEDGMGGSDDDDDDGDEDQGEDEEDGGAGRRGSGAGAGPSGRGGAGAAAGGKKQSARAAASAAAAYGDGVVAEGRYRDPGLYISHVRDGRLHDEQFEVETRAAELQAAVLDLTAEDQQGERGAAAWRCGGVAAWRCDGEMDVGKLGRQRAVIP